MWRATLLAVAITIAGAPFVAIPEPAALGAIACALLALSRRRYRTALPQ